MNVMTILAMMKTRFVIIRLGLMSVFVKMVLKEMAQTAQVGFLLHMTEMVGMSGFFPPFI